MYMTIQQMRRDRQTLTSGEAPASSQLRKQSKYRMKRTSRTILKQLLKSRLVSKRK